MSKEVILKVIGVSNPTPDKSDDHIPFKTVTYQEVEMIGNRDVKVPGSAVRNLWPMNYTRKLNGVDTVFRGDADYDTVTIGDFYKGEIMHFKTTPYQFQEGGVFITKWKGVVFKGEDGIIVAARALEQNHAKPMYETESGESIPFTLPARKAPVKIMDNKEENDNEPS